MRLTSASSRGRFAARLKREPLRLLHRFPVPHEPDPLHARAHPVVQHATRTRVASRGATRVRGGGSLADQATGECAIVPIAGLSVRLARPGR